MIERFINHFTVGQYSYEYIGNPDLKQKLIISFEIGFKGFKNLTGNFNAF
jgi:iron complex outermembrane receptor protein